MNSHEKCRDVGKVLESTFNRNCCLYASMHFHQRPQKRLTKRPRKGLRLVSNKRLDAGAGDSPTPNLSEGTKHQIQFYDERQRKGAIFTIQEKT